MRLGRRGSPSLSLGKGCPTSRRFRTRPAVDTNSHARAPAGPVYLVVVHFVIMGCGRVGSSLAVSLEERGHEVAVIDQNGAAFRRLGTTFQGRRVEGVGFDRDTLRDAGIE